MTDTNINSDDNCHACGKELSQDYYWSGNRERFFCSEECRLKTLEADLAEALELLEPWIRRGVETRWAQPCNRAAARLLAKHGRFKITKDDDWTEGFWPEK